MKSVYSVIFLSFLFILLLVTTVIGSDWVEYVKSDDGNIYSYNKVRIKHSTKNIVRVWNKMVFSDKGKENYNQRKRKIRGWTTNGYDKLSHSLTLEEIDCKERRYQILDSHLYDMNSNEVYDDSLDVGWNYIVPDSPEDTLRKIVCK